MKIDTDAISRSHRLNGESAQLRTYYRSWAESYDHDVLAEDYRGPQIMAELLDRWSWTTPSETAVLDAGCGTGLVGAELNQRGYTVVDGCDLSEEMTGLARRTGAYRSLHHGVDLNTCPGWNEKAGPTSRTPCTKRRTWPTRRPATGCCSCRSRSRTDGACAGLVLVVSTPRPGGYPGWEGLVRDERTMRRPGQTARERISMLALTPEAIEIVNAITSGPRQPEGAGVRIAVHEEAKQDGAFDLQVVPHPEDGDEVLVKTGVRIYLEREASLRLADKILGAEMNEHGQVHFTLAPQNGNHSGAHL